MECIMQISRGGAFLAERRAIAKASRQEQAFFDQHRKKTRVAGMKYMRERRSEAHLGQRSNWKLDHMGLVRHCKNLGVYSYVRQKAIELF